MSMGHHEHAQHIFALMVSGWAASGRPLPGGDEAKKWAEMAMVYAKAFAEANKAKPE